MTVPKTHYRDVRIAATSGASVPVCYTGQSMYDPARTLLRTTADTSKVTCKHCLRELMIPGAAPRKLPASDRARIAQSRAINAASAAPVRGNERLSRTAYLQNIGAFRWHQE